MAVLAISWLLHRAWPRSAVNDGGKLTTFETGSLATRVQAHGQACGSRLPDRRRAWPHGSDLPATVVARARGGLPDIPAAAHDIRRAAGRRAADRHHLLLRRRPAAGAALLLQDDIVVADGHRRLEAVHHAGPLILVAVHDPGALVDDDRH